PPYGAWTPGVTPTHGMHPVLWEVDPQDWLYRNSATVTQNVLDLTGPGDVILLHDIHQTSVDAVPMIIDSLRESGYTFATLDDLYATRPGCHVDQYCTAPVPYADTPSATTTVASAVVILSSVLIGASSTHLLTWPSTTCSSASGGYSAELSVSAPLVTYQVAVGSHCPVVMVSR